MKYEKVENSLEWGEILSNAGAASFLHSWEWGQFQTEFLGHKVDRLKLIDELETCGFATIIYERGRFGLSAYIPFAPFFCSSTAVATEVKRRALESLIGFLQDQEVFVIRVDPGTAYAVDDLGLFEELGFRSGLRPIQSVNNWVVEIQADEDAQFEWMKEHGMRKKLPKYVRGSRRKGVEVRQLDLSDFNIFTEMISDLSERIGVDFYSKEYFTEQFKYLFKGGVFRAYVAEVDGEPLASAVVAMYGDEVSYLHGASYPESGKYDAAYLLHWEIMSDARKSGFKYYNFWGVLIGDDYDESNPGYGYSFFKRGFGGYVRKYLPLQEYPVSMVKYYLYRALEKYRVFKIKRSGGY